MSYLDHSLISFASCAFICSVPTALLAEQARANHDY